MRDRVGIAAREADDQHLDHPVQGSLFASGHDNLHPQYRLPMSDHDINLQPGIDRRVVKMMEPISDP